MKNRIGNTKAKNSKKAKLVTLSETTRGLDTRPCQITLHLGRGVARQVEKYLEQDDATPLLDALSVSIYSAVKDIELTAGDFRSIAADMHRAERAAKQHAS